MHHMQQFQQVWCGARRARDCNNEGDWRAPLPVSQWQPPTQNKQRLVLSKILRATNMRAQPVVASEAVLVVTSTQNNHDRQRPRRLPHVHRS